MKRLFAPVLVLAVLSLVGCGYRPLLRDAKPPGGSERLSVPMVINETEHAGLEIPLTAIAVDRLDRYRAIQVTDDQADASFFATIRSAGLRPTNSVASGDGKLQAFRVTLVMDMELKRLEDGQVLWQVNGLRREADYTAGRIVVGEDILATEDLRQRALQEASERLMEEGIELMMGER